MASTIVIKLGGSLVSHPGVELFDFSYLERLKTVLTDKSNDDKSFFLAVGGGNIMRKYRDLAKEAGAKNDIDLHWIGTTVNVLHAYLIKAYFSDLADEKVMKYEDYYVDFKNKLNSKIQVGGGSSVISEDIEKKYTIAKKIMVGGGGRPGHSGDVDAVLAANLFDSNTVVSLKNVDGVYESDPKKNPDAKRLSKLSWVEYLEIIGNKVDHEPGGNYPIDPIASRMAMEKNLRFIILGGDDLENFGKYLKGEDYIGTEVS